MLGGCADLVVSDGATGLARRIYVWCDPRSYFRVSVADVSL